MKHITTVLQLLLVLLAAELLFNSCKLQGVRESNTLIPENTIRMQHPNTYEEIFFVEGDETPGIAGTRDTPDIAEVYWNRPRSEYHMHYPEHHYTKNLNLHMPGIRVIDWPEDFKDIMNQTGEINSPMKLTITGDTLHIEFTRD